MNGGRVLPLTDQSDTYVYYYSDLILNVTFLIQTYDLSEHNNLYDLMFSSSTCFICIINLVKHFYRVHIMLLCDYVLHILLLCLATGPSCLASRNCESIYGFKIF